MDIVFAVSLILLVAASVTLASAMRKTKRDLREAHAAAETAEFRQRTAQTAAEESLRSQTRLRASLTETLIQSGKSSLRGALLHAWVTGPGKSHVLQYTPGMGALLRSKPYASMGINVSHASGGQHTLLKEGSKVHPLMGIKECYFILHLVRVPIAGGLGGWLDRYAMLVDDDGVQQFIDELDDQVARCRSFPSIR